MTTPGVEQMFMNNCVTTLLVTTVCFWQDSIKREACNIAPEFPWYLFKNIAVTLCKYTMMQYNRNKGYTWAKTTQKKNSGR